jgi:hypothetical protein
VTAVAGALVSAAIRIRERRASRYAVLAVAVFGAAAYLALVRTGNPDVDVVEAFHLVEYGAIGALFYGAWRPVGDLRALLLPLTAGLTVGTVDEAFQWYLASRVGEAHDVGIDVAATACGVLFAVALQPLAAMRVPAARAARSLAVPTVAAASLFGLFAITAHAGYDIRDAEAGTFRSRYSTAALATLGRTPAEGLVEGGGRFAAENHYLSEARWHVRRRNDLWEERNVFGAWRENLILEKYFSHALDALQARWPPEQRADAERHGGEPATPYVSEASPIPIWAIRDSRFAIRD